MTFVILGAVSLLVCGGLWMLSGGRGRSSADLGVMSHQWMGEQRMAQSQDPQR